MGWVNAAYIAQTASELAYSQQSIIQFLVEKGWSAGSEDWPFQDISEIIVIYLDDLCLSTPQDIKNGRQVHLHALEFVF